MPEASPHNLRLAILGNSGSGKSSLARAIAAACGVAVLDLDTVAWEQGGDGEPRLAVDAADRVAAFCSSHDGWIVEGCYADLVTAALSFSPRLLFLNPGRAVCLANCRARPWEPHKYPSPEAQDANLAQLLEWVSAYDTREGDLSLAGHRACFDAYAGAKRELTQPVRLAPLDGELVRWVRAR